MECPAVACLWPRSPPSHLITAATTLLHHPHYLFTGGSDGAIICWTLPCRNVLPLALLCGHAAEIADLVIFSPYAVDPDSSNSVSSTLYPSELLSACLDGVLCAWNTRSLRCRQRRKLPLWVGTPSKLFVFHSSRFVCITCRSAESSKSSMLIVDTSTLLVVQTVIHSDLHIGSVRTIAFIPLMKEEEKGRQGVFLIDAYGKAQILNLSTALSHDGDGSSSLNLDLLTSIWGDGSSIDGVHSVVVAHDGNFLALIYEFRCEFRSLLSGSVLGKLSFPGTNRDNEESFAKWNLTRGMFLYRGGSSTVFEHFFFEEVPLRSFCFALFLSNGHALVYAISMSNTVFDLQYLCEVPANPQKSAGVPLIHFCQFNDSLVRLQSLSFSVRDLLVWKPLITIWSMVDYESSKKMENVTFSLSTLIGEGGFPDLHLFYPIEKLNHDLSYSVQQSEDFDSVNLSCVPNREADNDYILEDRAISSSMILSDDSNCRYSIVYGFYNGEIEVSELLNPSLNLDSLNYSNLPATKYLFSGHKDAVLCLAAICIPATSLSSSLHRILVSGSMDCTVRIWDMHTGSVIMVLHHHMAPVKQIILPQAWAYRPWNDCFLSVGEDGCVALVSIETFRVERMFPGHPSCPSVVAWDSRNGYLTCFCRSMLATLDFVDAVYLWDVKTGTREKIICGQASYSLLDHLCSGININIYNGSMPEDATSASSLLLPYVSSDSDLSHSRVAKFDAKIMQTQRRKLDFSESYSMPNNREGNLHSMSMIHETNSDSASNTSARKEKKLPIICSCPFPGIANLEFNLSSLPILPYSQNSKEHVIPQTLKKHSLLDEPLEDISVALGDRSNIIKEALEGYLLRFSLCFLHQWDIDLELDTLLKKEMGICKPVGFQIASGLKGDSGSMTIMFPGQFASLELWKISSEYCAMRSLIIVSIAQRMIHLYHSTTFAGSALAAFYTRNLAERYQDIKPPLLQLLVCFWQDPSEHVRMAARSLFHCAAPRAIPFPVYDQKTIFINATLCSVNAEVPIHSENDLISADGHAAIEQSLDTSSNADFQIVSWLESFEDHEWATSIGLSSQDAMDSCIIVAAALVVWYPSKVKKNLAKIVAARLIKLLMSLNERFSLTAVELLAEGMESSWKFCLGAEIPYLIGDIFSKIEHLLGTPASTIQESLVGILLPKLAMADMTSFLKLIEDQIWSISSDSPVHLVSLKTLIRILRGSPKPIALFLNKVVNYVLQTMSPNNLALRKACFTNSLLALKEIARALPMVALNDPSTRLAVGDAIGDMHNLIIHVYDLESVIKIKILDASCPLSLSTLPQGRSNTRLATALSAVSFSPDGEGLAAFSENGLLLRWWPLGIHWWEKLSRNFVPVQCTKLIFVPPWEGFSPNSSRSSVMSSIVGIDKRAHFLVGIHVSFHYLAYIYINLHI